MASDYLSLLQAALVNGKSTAYKPGTVSGRLSRPENLVDYSGSYDASAAEDEDEGFQFGDLNPLPTLGDAGMRAIDVLSRGNYATMNMLQEGIRDVREGDPTLQDGENLGPLNFLKAMYSGLDEPGQAWQGVSGQQKVTGATVTQDALGKTADDTNGWLKGGSALSLDILADPTTYIGGLGLLKLFKAGKGLSSITKASDELSDAVKAGHVGDSAVDDVLEIADDVAEGSVLTKTKKKQKVSFGDATPTIADDTDSIPTAAPPVATSSEVPPGFVATPEMIAQVQKLNLPLPVGNPINTRRFIPHIGGIPAREGMVAKGTDEFAVPAGKITEDATAAAHARSGEYVDLVGDIDNPVDLTRQYLTGAIRPVVDTPAEKELMYQINKYDDAGKERDVIDQEFNLYDSATRKSITQPSKAVVNEAGDVSKMGNPRVRIRLLDSGRTVEIPSDKLWKLMHGEAVDFRHTRKSGDVNLTPDNVGIKRAGETKYTPVRKIYEANNSALKSKDFWNNARKTAADNVRDPAALAERVMKSELHFIESAASRSERAFKTWMKQAKKQHPDYSDATLKRAYAEGQKVIRDAWLGIEAAKRDPSLFLRNKAVIADVQEVMTSAVLRHATPEELITDFARVNRKLANVKAAALLQIAKESAEANPGYAAKVADEADDVLKEADEAIEMAENAEEVAKAERTAEAKGNPTEVRKAAVTNGPSGEVADILKIGGGSDNWVDAGIGFVKKQTLKTLDNINDGLKGKRKRYPSYNQMKQTKTVTAAIDAIAKYSKTRNLSTTAKLGRTIQLIRATEFEMSALGYYPTVWNGLSGAARKNIHFSGAELLDDMLKTAPELAQRALKEPSFNHVLQAALLKGKHLDEIKDGDLKRFLSKYDADTNVAATKSLADTAKGKTLASTATTVDNAAKESAVLDSAARQAQNVKENEKAAKKAVTNTPGAPVETTDAAGAVAKGTTEQVNATVGVPTKTSKATNSNKNSLVAKDQKKSNCASQNVQKAAGSKHAPDAKPIEDEVFDKAVNSRIANAFSNHVGAKNTRPLMESSFNYVLSLISDSSRWWKEMHKRYDDEQLLTAVRAMRPGIDPPTDEVVRKLHDAIRGRMEGILGGSGIEKAIKGNSTATRMGITPEIFNKWMRQKTVRDAEGKLYQIPTHSEDGIPLDGLDWLKQWEFELPKFKTGKEALAYMHNMEAAMYSAAVERTLMDDLVVQFAKPGSGYSVKHPYLQGAEFPKEIALEAKRMVEMIEALQFPKSSGKFWSTYDQALRLWKTGVTIYNPVHHVRNFAGDSFLLFGDGGKVRHLGAAAKMLNKYKEANYDTEVLFKGISPRGMPLETAGDIEKLKSMVMRGPTEGKTTVKVKGTDTTFSDDQIMAMAYQTGMFQTAGNVEDIMQAGANFISDFGNKYSRLANPLGGRGHKVATRTAENREHLVRLAHYVHAVETSGVKRLKGMSDSQYRKLIMEDAAQRVRKYHPDGLDLTAFERKYMRRAIPFYSWQRKSIPLILGISVQRPGLVTAYPKAQQAVSYGSGNLDPNDTHEMNRMLPGGELLPDFITGSPYAVVGNSEEGGVRVASGPSTPAVDFFDMLNTPGGSAMGMLTPFATAPASVVYGKDPRTGVPLENFGDKAEYLAETIPGVSNVSRWNTNKQPASVDFMNWLTGSGVMDTKGYEKVAEFDELERAQKEAGR